MCEGDGAAGKRQRGGGAGGTDAPSDGIEQIPDHHEDGAAAWEDEVVGRQSSLRLGVDEAIMAPAAPGSATKSRWPWIETRLG